MNPENLQPLPPGGKPAGETGSKQPEEFVLEEDKDWPGYIRERLDALNSVNSLNLERLSELLSEDSSLVSPELLDYLSQQFKLARENNQVLPTLPQEMVDCFAKLANDEDPYVRQGVALALGNLGEPALRILEEMKNDKNPYVRQGVALALHRLGKTDLALRILEEMKNNENLFVRQGVALALGNLGEPALRILEEMKNDKNPYVRQGVALALHRLGKTDLALRILEEMKNNENPFVRQGVALALGNLGEPALAILEKMKNDEDPVVRRDIALALGNLGEPALGILEEMADDERYNVRLEVASAFHQLGKTDLALKILTEMANDENPFVRQDVASALGNLGEPALETLKEMRNDENPYVRKNVASVLGNLGEPALRILEEMKNDEDPYVRQGVALALLTIRLQNKKERERIIRSLIVRQEPVFANPALEAVYPEEIQDNLLLKLNDIISSLQRKYPNLIGLSVLGSLSKGYWIPSSDLDWSLIYTDMEPEDVEKMTEEFRRAAQEAGFRLCMDYSVDATNPGSCVPESLEPAFNGIFIGDRRILRELQARIVNTIDEEGWEEIRQNWSKQLKNYSKMIKRFGLTPGEVRIIQGLRRFLWSLPSYQEAQEEFAAKEENL